MANYARNHMCTLFRARVHLPMPSVASHHAPTHPSGIKRQNSRANEGNLLFQGINMYKF